jgi:hypothetical protein
MHLDSAVSLLVFACCCALQESVELRPMYGASDASDASAASDSGGASFLGQLWDAVQVRGG